MSYHISIIIPVYQEMAVIQKTISHVRRLAKGASAEIIVVDGDIQGSTLQVIDQSDIIKTIAPKGRASQMNKGASLAKGEILLFLHADTFLPESALRTLQSAHKKKARWAGGAFELGIDASAKYYRIIEQAVKLRTRLTKIPYGDQAIFIKKEIFFNLGGFPPIPLMEDVSLMRIARKAGLEIIILPMQVKTSSRRWEEEGVLYCTLRNWVLLILYHAGIPPKKLVQLYYR